MPRGCLRFVIVVFPDHTHLLFLHYKCLVLILKIVCISINETSLKQFSLEIKSNSPFLGMNLFTVQQILNSLG